MQLEWPRELNRDAVLLLVQFLRGDRSWNWRQVNRAALEVYCFGSSQLLPEQQDAGRMVPPVDTDEAQARFLENYLLTLGHGDNPPPWTSVLPIVVEVLRRLTSKPEAV